MRYTETTGDFSRKFRLWSVVSDVELGDALARIRALDEAGELDAFVAEQDRMRPSVGQIGFHYAVREPATDTISV